MGGSGALGGFCMRANLGSNYGVLRCLLHLVVRLKNVSARREYAFRRTQWARNFLFWRWQDDLFRRADHRRLGNRTSRCPAKDEGNLAGTGVGGDRIYWRQCQSSGNSARDARRNWTCGYGFCFLAFGSGFFIRLVSYPDISFSNGDALCDLAIAPCLLHFCLATDSARAVGRKLADFSAPTLRH